VCNQQIITDVTLSGTHLSPLPVRPLHNDPDLAIPDVTLTPRQDLAGAEQSGTPVLLSGLPRFADQSRVFWDSQSTLVFRVDPELNLADGLFDVRITNPNQQAADLPGSLLALPPPRLSSVNPDLVCGDQANAIDLTGEMLVRFSLALPTVAFGEQAELAATTAHDCVALPGASGAEACSGLQVDIPAATLPSPAGSYAHYPLVARNPETVQCRSSEPIDLTVVPAPELDTVVPVLACLAQSSVAIELSGRGFLTIDGATPTVSVGDAHLPTVADPSTCTSVPGPVALVKTCTRLTATIPQGRLTEGVYNVTITNPAPADCTSSEPAELHIVPPPDINAVVPEVACVSEGARWVRIEGSGFLFLDSTSTPLGPTVTIAGTDLVSTYAPEDCTGLAEPPAQALTCSAIIVEVPSTFAVGAYDVLVTNPTPAACTALAQASFYVVPPPSLSSIVPAAVCLNQDDVEVTVTGEGFVAFESDMPTLYLNDGTAVAYLPQSSDLGGCVALGDTVATVEVCTSFVVTIPREASAAGVTTYDAWVENPAPSGCSSASTTLSRYPEGVVSAVTTMELCTGGGVVALEGAELAPSARVLVGTLPSDSEVVAADGSSMTAYFPMLLPGTFDVFLENASGCVVPLQSDISVGLGATGFFVDPPVVFNGMATRLTIYAAQLSSPVGVDLVPTDGSDPMPLVNIDSSDPDEIRATVPMHDPPTTDIPPGVYNIQLTGAGGGCDRALLTNAMTITDQTDVDLASLQPTLAWSGSATAITLDASEAGSPFVSIPRLYLNPVSGTGTAVAIQAVTFLDDTTLTAQVPAGLNEGTYDIIVVNPDGTVGISDADAERLQVLADPPPVIETISPGFVLNNTLVTLRIEGEHFDTSPLAEVTLLCEDSASNTWVTEVTETAGDGSFVEGTFTITQQTEAYCVVRATNADQSFGEFSSLVVVGNDQKLFPFAAGPELNVARRALAAAAGRATSAARYLYAIGGDDGTDAGVLDTVEATAVDIHGVPYGFKVLHDPLSVPRARHGAVTVGRFVYIVGGTSEGNDPTKTLASVERAYILSPDERPTVEAVDLDVNDEGEGLGSGLWYYRVSALMASDDPFNPGGESLPSEAFVVRLPDLGTYRVRPTITWSAVPGAIAYRIYRSPTGVEAAGEERLAWQTVDARVSDVDTGYVPQSSAPLQIGALGRWHTIDAGGTPLQLNTPRKGAALVAAVSPDGATVALYVLLGHDGNDFLSSFEWCSLTLEADGRQNVVTGFQEVTPVGPNALTPRWLTSAWVATPENSPNVAGNTYLYLGGGDVGTTNPCDELDVATIDWSAGGALSAGFASAGGSASMQQQHGYGAVIANNYLYAFGGKQNIDASATCHQTHICNDDGLGCTGKVAPAVDNWTNTESGMLVPRRLMGLAVESAFIYILGGESVGGPTSSTEMTIW
jgi:hypothetical protein